MTTEFFGKGFAEAINSKNVMTNFSKNLLWLVIVVVIIGGFILWQKQEPKELPTIRLGLQTAPAIGLVKVAVDKNFFADEGIQVEVKEFTGGKFALQALTGGSLDLVTPAELPVTLATLNGEKLSILAQVNETKGFSMLLRKDGESSFAAEKYFAKKRKIATSVGASPEFFASEFFKKYNVNSSQYEIVSMRPEDAPIALANGSVDGIAIYEPFASFAKKQAGIDSVFEIKAPEIYSEIIVLVGKTDWISQNEKIAEKFLRALKKSEEFIKSNPEEAINIVSSFTKLDKETLRSIWPTFTLSLNLGNKLVPTMEAEAQWAKNTGKVPKETATPNFRDIIFEAPLRKVVPSAVEL